MEKKPIDHAFTFKDNPAITETFADGVRVIIMDGSTLRIDFTVSRPDPPKSGSKSPTGQKVLALRLVMPGAGLAELYNQLDRLVRGLEAKGMLTRDRSGGGGVAPTVQ